jgi:MoxR-like ATPase
MEPILTKPVPHPAARPEGDLAAVRELHEARRLLLAEIEKRIVGQRDVVDHLLVALFARGHCLFVGVPGLAKTLLISTVAEVLNLSFNRIQFTPDLMPSDITGTEIIEEDRETGRRELTFVQGPVFANIVMADVIRGSLETWMGAFREAGVLVTPAGPQRMRLVTHVNISTRDVDEALGRVERAVGAATG